MSADPSGGDAADPASLALPLHSVVACMACLQTRAVPVGSTGLDCAVCGRGYAFFHCPRCRWPLLVAAGSGMVCAGCGTQSRDPLRTALAATASVVSYFQGLAAVSPQDSEVTLVPAWTAVGAWGVPFRLGSLVSLAVTATHVHLTPIGDGGPPVPWPFTAVRRLVFDGPGRVTTRDRFSGWGVGLVGSLEGILAAETLNALTRRATVNSFITVEADDAGVILHTARLTPGQLRLLFAGALRRVTPRPLSGPAPAGSASASEAPGLAEQLERIAALHRDGMLTDEEFSRAKARILGP